jgi:hypothetical protein
VSNRSGYSDDIDQWALIRWRGAVKQAIRGKRGQRLLKDLLAALDAMPGKRLIVGEFIDSGDYCALGVLGAARGLPIEQIDLESIDRDAREEIAEMFGVSRALVAEIMYENDELYQTPEARWSRMRAWVASKIKDESA